jgi:hypothetical protein
MSKLAQLVMVLTCIREVPVVILQVSSQFYPARVEISVVTWYLWRFGKDQVWSLMGDRGGL